MYIRALLEPSAPPMIFKRIWTNPFPQFAQAPASPTTQTPTSKATGGTPPLEPGPIVHWREFVAVKKQQRVKDAPVNIQATQKAKPARQVRRNRTRLVNASKNFSMATVPPRKGHHRRSVSERDVSIIIPACNEEPTLKINLRRLRKWNRVREIIVVVNGCKDKTREIAEQYGAVIVEFPEALGHDTGRAVGAQHARGKYLLFLDADILWTLSDLRPFVQALKHGADIALNEYPQKTSHYYHHPTAIAKRALNIVVGMPHLQAASLTSVPHAMRQSAVARIGCPTLAVPPLAMAQAALAGLKIVKAHYVDVRTRNRWRRRYDQYSTKEVILGDHIEAFAHVISMRGVRGGFSDIGRNRTIIQEGLSAIHPDDGRHDNRRGVAAIIPARNEAKTLTDVLREVRHAHIHQICVIENGSTDKTASIARRRGAQVQRFDHSLGHDVGRAIGTMSTVNANCTLFLDGDFCIPADDLQVFTKSVLRRGVDVALNDMTAGLHLSQRRDAVSTLKAFLNIALQRPDLGVSSLTAVPHALSKRALATIPTPDLAVPPKALVRAVLAGLSIRPVHYVDVVKPNRYRRFSHAPKYGARVSRLIVGDHVEAIALLIADRGTRGGFVQPRSLHVLEAPVAVEQDL